MFVNYLHTKYHLPISNGSLVIAVKLKYKEIFRTADVLFYILQKNPSVQHINSVHDKAS
jgi:hypothetical protein